MCKRSRRFAQVLVLNPKRPSDPRSALLRSAIRRSDGPSYRQSRSSITLQPVVAIFLPPTHAHLVVDHRYGVMSGRAQMLIVLNRTPCLFLATQLRKGGGQNEVENGWPILIHAVDFDDLVVITR